MDDGYHYPDFQHYLVDHVPISHEVQFYPHNGVHNLTAPTAMLGVPYTHGDTVKGAPFPPFGPVRYPRSSADLGYWAPPSPFEDSVRSISPQTDCQSNSCMPPLSYDDSMSCASGFESSPSPSYPDMPALYKQESMSSAQPVHSIPQPSPMFLQVYGTHQPTEFTTSPTSTTSEAIEAPKPRKAFTRKGSRVQKQTNKTPKKAPARSNRTKQVTATKQPSKKATDRRFQCCFARYGCPSTFPSKNEWKRHVSSQHIQPGYYRCDVGRCSLNNLKNRSTTPIKSQTQSPPSISSAGSNPASANALVNDFNRKDLFIQHQRRMHAPWNTPAPASSSSTKSKLQPASQAEKQAFEASLETVWKRCWRQLRAPPTLSQCGFCNMEFRGASAWKERMEHVARHFEKRDPGPENEDVPLREWAVENGVVAWVRGEWRLVSLSRK